MATALRRPEASSPDGDLIVTIPAAATATRNEVDYAIHERMRVYRTAIETARRKTTRLEKADWDQLADVIEEALREAQERGELRVRRQVYAELGYLQHTTQLVLGGAYRLNAAINEAAGHLGDVPHPHPMSWADPFREVYHWLSWVIQECQPGRTSARKDLLHHVTRALETLSGISGFRYGRAPKPGQDGGK